MRFGIKFMPERTTWADLLAVTKAADDGGIFESVWNFDHFYPIYTNPPETCLEGWTTIAAMAQATTRVRIGVMVTGVPYRHPAVVAKMAATVDHISGGRLELGLGAGWNERESTAYGIPLGTMTERFDRFDEACTVIRSLLDEGTTNFSGTYYQLVDAHCDPKPVQKPHPPICIGGAGEKRTLRAVARFADHWNFPGGGVDDFQRKRDVLHKHCADIRRDPAEITISTHLISWPDNEIPALVQQAEAYAAAGLDLAIPYLWPTYTPKQVDELAKALAGIG